MEVIEYFLELAIQGDTFSIIIKIIKPMRIIFLVIISYFVYRYFVSDFVLSTSIEDIWTFFVSGYFLKPFGIFISTWFAFDVILCLMIKKIFDFLFIDRMVKKYTKLVESLSQDSSMQGKANDLSNRKMDSMLSWIPLIKNHVKKPMILPTGTVNKFDRIALLIVQLMIIFYLTHANILAMIFSVIFLVFLEYIKACIISYKIFDSRIFSNYQIIESGDN